MEGAGESGEAAVGTERALGGCGGLGLGSLAPGQPGLCFHRQDSAVRLRTPSLLMPVVHFGLSIEFRF